MSAPALKKNVRALALSSQKKRQIFYNVRPVLGKNVWVLALSSQKNDRFFLFLTFLNFYRFLHDDILLNLGMTFGNGNLWYGFP